MTRIQRGLETPRIQAPTEAQQATLFGKTYSAPFGICPMGMGAILAIRAAGQEPRLRIRSSDGRRVTFVREVGEIVGPQASIALRTIVDSAERSESGTISSIPPCVYFDS